MEKKSLWERIIDWFRKLLRMLFPSNVLAMMGLGDSENGKSEPEPLDGDERELSEEELRRMKETPVERRHILFFGRVQGVGFRYQAMYGARNLGLTGWVSNLSDGSVEMEVQGPVAVIDHMIHNLQKGRWIRIEGMESKVIPVVPGERGFQVRGY